MWPLAIGLLLVGFALAGLVGELSRAESARWALAGRVGFALTLAVELLGTALVFEGQFASAFSAQYVSRSGWWLVTGAGVGMVLLVGLGTVRQSPRRLVHLAATAAGAAAFVLFPYAFVPEGAPLHGLARSAHTQHALAALVLLVPSLLALAAALPRRRETLRPSAA